MVIVGNILNIIAPIVQNVAFLFKSKTKVLFGVLCASVIWIVAYILLGTYAAAVLTCLGVIIPIVNYFTEKADKKRLWWVYILYIAFIVTVTVLFYESPLDILPSVAMSMLMLSTLPENQIVFRLILMGMSSVWLGYGIAIAQFGIIVGNAIQIVSLIAAMIFYGLKKPREDGGQP